MMFSSELASAASGPEIIRPLEDARILYALPFPR